MGSGMTNKEKSFKTPACNKPYRYKQSMGDMNAHPLQSYDEN